MADKENQRVHMSKKHYARGMQPVETMSPLKQKATYAGRYLNTAAKKAVGGPAAVDKARKAKPGSVLSKEEMKNPNMAYKKKPNK